MNRPEHVLNPVEDKALKSLFRHRPVESVWDSDTDRQCVQFWINFDEEIGAIPMSLQEKARKSVEELVEWGFWEPTH